MNKRSENYIIDYLASSLTVFLIVFFLYIWNGFDPFGNNTLAVMDATIQYLDFFAYLKDVLNGNNSLLYTFSKTLGGSCIAVFSYYLASPLNLLIYFFEKSNLTAFFNFLVLIKLCLADLSMCFFLHRRFVPDAVHKRFFVCTLSMSYALCQYAIAQSSNIMWLDGFIMLPLMMHGIHELLYKKSIISLSITTGLAIIFNWYSGAINCFFSVIWLAAELVLYFLEEERKINYKIVFEVLGRYFISMFFGIMISCVLFLPNLHEMLKSNRTTLDFNSFFDFSLIGNPLTMIASYSIGSLSKKGRVTVFSGSMAIIGYLSLLFIK